MKDSRGKIEGLPRDVAISFGVHCARLAFFSYDGKRPEVLAHILDALESDTAELPTTTAINKLLKEAKVIYAETRIARDAANAYVAFSVYAALRSFSTQRPHIDAHRAMSSACKSLKFMSPDSENVIVENLKQLCSRSE